MFISYREKREAIRGKQSTYKKVTANETGSPVKFSYKKFSYGRQYSRAIIRTEYSQYCVQHTKILPSDDSRTNEMRGLRHPPHVCNLARLRGGWLVLGGSRWYMCHAYKLGDMGWYIVHNGIRHPHRIFTMVLYVHYQRRLCAWMRRWVWDTVGHQVPYTPLTPNNLTQFHTQSTPKHKYLLHPLPRILCPCPLCLPTTTACPQGSASHHHPPPPPTRTTPAPHNHHTNPPGNSTAPPF